MHATALTPCAIADGGIARLVTGSPRTTINEADSKKLLAAQGLPVTREAIAGDANEAATVAAEIGYPLVLKVVSDDIPHKSELGLIVTGISDEAALRAAWRTLQERVHTNASTAKITGFLVQEMVTGGLEVFAGVSRDPDFGLMLGFGLGGVAIEILKDFTLRQLPLRAGDAAAMIAATKASALLAGARAQQPYDVESLIACIERFAGYAYADGDYIAEIDLNPIIVLPAGCGCRIVDALIIPREPTHGANA
jgi:succinyl-CoA synthetase beta subunit